MSKIFTVAPGRTVFSREHDQFFEPGQTVEFTTTPDADLALVVASGALIPVAEIAVPEETDNG